MAYLENLMSSSTTNLARGLAIAPAVENECAGKSNIINPAMWPGQLQSRESSLPRVLGGHFPAPFSAEPLGRTGAFCSTGRPDDVRAGDLAADLPFGELKQKAHINVVTRAADHDPNFSRIIRERATGVSLAGWGLPCGSQTELCAGWSVVGCRLDTVQLRIRTLFCHQLLVCAELYESCSIEYNDKIGHADRRETMGHENRDAAGVASPDVSRRCGIALEQRMLGLCIQCGSRFVEYQQQRLIAHETARQSEFLPLAKR